MPTLKHFIVIAASACLISSAAIADDTPHFPGCFANHDGFTCDIICNGQVVHTDSSVGSQAVCHQKYIAPRKFKKIENQPHDIGIFDIIL